jgi:hypothetical protein
MSWKTAQNSSPANSNDYRGYEGQGHNAYYTTASYPIALSKELPTSPTETHPNVPSLRNIPTRQQSLRRGKMILIAILVLGITMAVALGIGLGLGLKHQSNNFKNPHHTPTKTDQSMPTPTPSTKDQQMYVSAFNSTYSNLDPNPRRVGWLDKFPIDRFACGVDYDASVEGVGGCTLAQAMRGNSSDVNAPIFYADGDWARAYVLAINTTCDASGAQETGPSFTPLPPANLAPPLVQRHLFNINYRFGCVIYHVNVDIQQGGLILGLLVTV